MIKESRYKQERHLRDKRDVRQLLFYTSAFILLVTALSLKRCLGPAFKHANYIAPTATGGSGSFNWTNAVINYTAHARCRMGCRHINEDEVTDILKNGKVNIAKSELEVVECEQRYAIDGYSRDNQHLRIIAAHCGNKATIITCIDLDHDWSCDCGKDY